MLVKQALWLDYPLRKRAADTTVQVPSKKEAQRKAPEWVEYTHREELEALPYKVLVKLGDADKLEPLKVPEGFGYLWQNFAVMRQVCGGEARLPEIRAYTEVFMPEATVTDIYLLCLMNNTACAFTRKMEEEDIDWPEE